MDPLSVFIINANVQSLGLSGQAAPWNTLQLQEWLLRLGPNHENAPERGILMFDVLLFVK